MFAYSYFIKNGALEPIAAIDDSFDIQVYEVIRLVEGAPLFFEEHLQRFVASCQEAGVNFSIDNNQFAQNLVELADKNGASSCNVRYFVNQYIDRVEFYAGFIQSTYPTDQQYTNGVDVDLLYMERLHPNAKILNRSLREQADAAIKAGNLYEVALVNTQNQITEGSRSNIFFITPQGVLVTAPLKAVLGGVTRMVILEEAYKAGVKVEEREVGVEEAIQMSAAFISGTSPSVLPVDHFAGHRLDVSNPLLTSIANLYRSRMEADILGFRQRYLR